MERSEPNGVPPFQISEDRMHVALQRIGSQTWFQPHLQPDSPRLQPWSRGHFQNEYTSEEACRPSPELLSLLNLGGFLRWHYYCHRVQTIARSSHSWSYVYPAPPTSRSILPWPNRLLPKSPVRFLTHQRDPPFDGNFHRSAWVHLILEMSFAQQCYHPKNQVLSFYFLKWQFLLPTPLSQRDPLKEANFSRFASIFWRISEMSISTSFYVSSLLYHNLHYLPTFQYWICWLTTAKPADFQHFFYSFVT